MKFWNKRRSSWPQTAPKVILSPARPHVSNSRQSHAISAQSPSIRRQMICLYPQSAILLRDENPTLSLKCAHSRLRDDLIEQSAVASTPNARQYTHTTIGLAAGPHEGPSQHGRSVCGGTSARQRGIRLSRWRVVTTRAYVDGRVANPDWRNDPFSITGHHTNEAPDLRIIPHCARGIRLGRDEARALLRPRFA